MNETHFNYIDRIIVGTHELFCLIIVLYEGLTVINIGIL